jgi:hypothetical protein
MSYPVEEHGCLAAGSSGTRCLLGCLAAQRVPKGSGHLYAQFRGRHGRHEKQLDSRLVVGTFSCACDVTRTSFAGESPCGRQRTNFDGPACVARHGLEHLAGNGLYFIKFLRPALSGCLSSIMGTEPSFDPNDEPVFGRHTFEEFLERQSDLLVSEWRGERHDIASPVLNSTYRPDAE